MNLIAVELDAINVSIGITNVVFDADGHLNYIAGPNKFVPESRRVVLISSIRRSYAYEFSGIWMLVVVWHRCDRVLGRLYIVVRRIAIYRGNRTFRIQQTSS